MKNKYKTNKTLFFISHRCKLGFGYQNIYKLLKIYKLSYKMKKYPFLFIVVILLVTIIIGISSAASPNKKTVIVLYTDDVTDEDEYDLEKIGARIKYTHKIIPAITTYVDEEDIDDIELDEDVVAVFEDMVVHTFLANSVPQIRANQVHSAGVTGSGVKVCIVDTGVDDTHPALNPLVAEHDFVNNDPDATDDHGHGTHVAGIVASTDATYKGVAYGSSLMAAKVLDATGSGFSSDVIAGIDWCVANGAKIISMSLGGGAFTSTCDSDPLAQASNNAVNNGVVVFAASGNNGFLNAIATPACGSKVIAVGAVDKNDGRTAFSNEGTKLDLVAPGVSIVSTVPTSSCQLCSTTGFRSLSGTSMATPHASGIASLLLQANSFLSPKEVRDFLRETTKDLGVVGFDTIYGYGRVDAFAAWNAVKNKANTMQIFFDNFQGSNFVKFVESNEFDWRIITPKEKSVPDAPSGNLVAHADACTSSAGCILTLKDPIDLSKFQSATLKFWRYVDNDIDSGEFLRVQVFNGISWATIFEWTNGKGDDDTWHHESFGLSNYLVNGFKIRFISKQSSTAEDVEIDDVLIKGIPKLVGNQPPIANAGSDQTKNDADGNGIETFTLNGSASSDPDGTITAYGWREGNIILGTTAIITTSFSVGSHTVTLNVTDNNNTSSIDTTIIIVNPNQAPTANAGPDQIVSDNDNNGFELITLNGSLSFDPDGSIVSYEWKEGVTILGINFIINVNLSLGTHNIVLAVTDNGGASNSDTAIVTVTKPIALLAPTGLTASDGEAEITLTWNANSEPDLAGYNIYRATTPGGPYTKVATVGIVITYTNTNIEGTFYYVITAFNQAGNESPYSNEASAIAVD